MEDCIFCKIIKKELPSTLVYEDENVIAFNDLYPQAPIHIIVIPKEHVANVTESDGDMIKNIFNAINKIVKEKGIDKTGFRVVTNCGEDAGQTVSHLHFHILAGKKLEEKSL